MLYLIVFFSLIGCVKLITVKSPQKFVNVTTGGSVHLQCTFVTSHETDDLTIKWDMVAKNSMSTQQLYYYQSGEDVITEAFEGRLQPPQSPATTFNASIILSNMQPADAGVYTCAVHNFPDVDGQSEVNIMVNVHEKPSQPDCSVHGDVESGQLVTLTCHSDRGSPSPTYTWIKLDQSKTQRPILGQANDTGILQIANISQLDFGEYQCNATNAAGFATCTIELNAEVGIGVIVGAVIGTLLGCLLIALVVWFIVHTVKTRKYDAVKVSKSNEMKGRAAQVHEAAVSAESETPVIVEEDQQPQA